MGQAKRINGKTILEWLRETEPRQLRQLYGAADRVRREFVGDAVHLRGVIEISNHCRRLCLYCGLRAGNCQGQRYRMTAEEILACARTGLRLGYGTVMLQAGEDPGLTAPWIAEVVRQIKHQTGLPITLSLGERDEEELALWRQAGAERYLLRFETSDVELFRIIHPSLPGKSCDRIAQLKLLRRLGYEVGSGVMIGIPGQSYRSLARDLELFRELDLDTIVAGPYLPHPATPLAHGAVPASPDQVPNTGEMVYKVLALARFVCPEANIPSTTALATLNRVDGQERGLMAGANVVRPNLTPPQYRPLYESYPNQALAFESSEQCAGGLRQRIRRLGRVWGSGPGRRVQIAGWVATAAAGSGGRGDTLVKIAS
jgi:biotin synthase